MRPRAQHGITASPILAGALAILLGGIGIILSYNANKGLPFVPLYDVSVSVPDAAELTKQDEVRIGGARVGSIASITAHPGPNGKPPYAILELGLQRRLQPLPRDSYVQVRPRSVLGGKYLALVIGRSKSGLAPGAVLPVKQARRAVEFDEAFKIFDKDTGRGLREAIGGLASGFAGRGSAFNETIGSVSALLGPTQKLLRVLISPRTDLAGFIEGASQTTAALAAVSPQLASLIDHSATTFAAINAAGSAFGRSIEEIPSTETVGTRTLRDITPVLADAAAITRAIRPGTRVLPVALPRLATAVEAGTITLRPAPQLADDLGEALTALDALARDSATAPAVRELTETITLLHPALNVLEPAQVVCNVGGLWTRNVSSTVSQGDAAGSWIRGAFVTSATEALQSATPDPALHANPTPHENASECEVGNEPYTAGQLIGNPPGLQSTTVPQTEPPADARARAAAAGLLTPTPGAHP